ncbi:hypothetical protein DH2020_031828 [Rehmannia glutinosa]|uniref:SHSP domain-containing protein n=1 Tax=Rehmannia glutinosa TaxID=99300 RepID=A0ABR0VJ62_REHGL
MGNHSKLEAFEVSENHFTGNLPENLCTGVNSSVYQMETQVVRRRANVIAAHLASHEDISATATHVFPMSCSNSLNSVIRRYDNRTLFARQGSTSQGCYMRPASIEQGTYMQPGTPLKSSGCGNKGSNALEPPAFSRPAQVEPGIPSVKGIQSKVQGCKYTECSPEAPMFSRPNKKCGQPQFHTKERTNNFASKGVEWSPRMDVVESGYNYIVTLEIPGVSIDNIRVEVDDHRDGLLRINIPKLSGLRWLRKAHM